MSRVLKTSKLINSVRSRAMIPDDTSTYTDQDILDILNEETDAGLLSTLMTLNEEHLVTTQLVTVENQVSRYKIPYRAVGNKLRDVGYKSSDGVRELSRISLEEVSDYRNSQNAYYSDVFYIEGDEVVLVNPIIDANEIVMHYYLRPNVLVLESLCGVITNIDRNTGVITLSSFPSNFSNLPSLDFVQARTPNKILNFDVTMSASSSNLLTVTVDPNDIPKDLIVGDYVCEAETTCVPNFPTELHPLLAQRAALFILEAMGDTEGIQLASRKLAQMENSIQNILEDRVEGAPQKINARHSPLSQTIHSGKQNRRGRY